MVGKPKVINLMSLSHSLVEWWVVRQDYRGRGGAEINKLSWWKQQNISKRAPLALWLGLARPCWCKNLITQTFNSAEVIMKIAKRNGKENSKYWHYWKWHPPFKFSKVIVWFRPSSILFGCGCSISRTPSVWLSQAVQIEVENLMVYVSIPCHPCQSMTAEQLTRTLEVFFLWYTPLFEK